jgi:photosystem II Psb28-2 protein
MSAQIPSIQFFEGIYEELGNVSLRRNRSTGVRSIVMIFDSLKAIEKLNSFTKRSSNSIILTDEEGVITVEPTSVQISFGGADGDELKRVECKVEIEREDHWERMMRFMTRYAQTNGMSYSETGQSTGSDSN